MKEELFGSSDTAVSQEEKEEGAEEKEQQAAAEKKLPVDRVAVSEIRGRFCIVGYAMFQFQPWGICAFDASFFGLSVPLVESSMRRIQKMIAFPYVHALISLSCLYCFA